MDSEIDRFWHEFLIKTGRDPDLKYYEAFHFELSQAAADELLELVLSGKKQATASSALYYEAMNEQMPKQGDFSIVTDWKGTPFCIIETASVKVIPFRDIDYETCSREGEDETLESWRKNHIKYFTEDGKQAGYEFTFDMPVAFEDFKVVYRRPDMK